MSNSNNHSSSTGLMMKTYSEFLMPGDEANIGNISNFSSNVSTDVYEGSACCVPGLERFIVPAIFSVVVLLGCLGNTLVIIVVFKNKDHFRNTTNLFILNLAIADMLFLIFCVPFHAIIYTLNDWPFGEFMCKFVHLVQFSSMMASIFTLVAMSLDRYLAVGHPIRTKHLRTPWIALLVSVLTWTFAIGIAIPWPIVYTVRVYNNHGPQEMAYCADDWGEMAPHKSTYHLILFIFAYALPLIAIFVLSVLMIQQLWAVHGPASEGPRHRQSLQAKRKVTRLIIVVVLVFCVCWLPSHISWLWTSYWPHTVPHTYAFYIWRIASHVLSYANSSMNPVIYAFLSSQFRKGFHKALQCDGDRITTHTFPFTKSMYSASINDRVPSTLAETLV